MKFSKRLIARSLGIKKRYSTIEELLEMLGRIETLQKLIFQSLRPTSNNEARIAALVPLVEESYGIYEFLVSMLTAMHQGSLFSTEF